MTKDIAIWKGKRVFFLGVNTGFVSDGQPDDRFLDFYRERSSALLHCAIVGNVVVPSGYGSNPSTPFIGTNPIWSQLAAAMKEKGTLPGIQLATAWEGYKGARNFLSADSNRVIRSAKEMVSALGPTGIETVMKGFESASAMAVGHGFKHIQFHAAHGYLLNLLIDDRINPKADHVQERLATIAHNLRGQGVESSLRISIRAGDDEFDADNAESFQDRLSELPFDFVDLSSGFYNINKRLIYPSRADVITSRFVESLEIVQRNPKRQFIVSGRISPRVSELPSNAHIGVCRDLIANPDFLAEPLNGCRSHGKCHYFSRGEKQIVCPMWNKITLTKD